MISVKLPQPQFDGSTRTKLGSDIVERVETFVSEGIGRYFETNPAIAGKIVARARTIMAASSMGDFTHRQ